MNDREQVEEHLICMIDSIYRDAEKAAKPYLDQLSRLRCLDPPAQIIMTKEEYYSIAHMLPKL